MTNCSPTSTSPIGLLRPAIETWITAVDDQTAGLEWTSSRLSPTRSVPPMTRLLLTPTGSSAVTPSSRGHSQYLPVLPRRFRPRNVLPLSTGGLVASDQCTPHSLLAPRITLAAVRRGPRPCRLCRSPPADPRGLASARRRGLRQRRWRTEVRTQHRKRLTSNAGRLK